MPSLEAASLIDSVSQLLELNSDIYHAVAEEISSAKIPYRKVYDDYHSGGWYTATLYTPNECDDRIRDGISKPTELANRLPITRRFLEDLGLELFTVRIARMEPDSCLWEHRDYIELDGRKERLRLHVPLITNPQAAIHFPGWNVHMTPGWIWKLDPIVIHAASNLGAESRTHLILDCYINKTLREMLVHEKLDIQYLQQQPKLGKDERQMILEQAHDIFKQEGSAKAEQHLLKLFHRFDLSHETTYDLLANFYRDMGFAGREKYWIQEHITRIYSREQMDPNATTTDVCFTLQAVSQASSSELPQIRILERILEIFHKCPGFEKAFVRGSLARGNADLYSDIDLLCEVSPHHFVSFIEAVDRDIKSHHNAIADGLVDNVVKDFGGIGYIYLLEANGRIYQLDLYITCQGKPWGSETFRREISRRIHRENDIEKHAFLLYRLHGAKVGRQIQCLQNVDPSVGQTLVELNVLGVMLKKCLERGDNFVASNEYNMWRICFVKMLRQKFDVKYRDYGLYHLKRLVNEAVDGSTLFEDLGAIFTSPLTIKNFVQVHKYAMDFAQKHFSEDCARHRRLLDAVSRHIEGSQPETVPTKLTSRLCNTLDLYSG